MARKTLTDIKNAEENERAEAARYERALNDRDNVKRCIARVQPQVEFHTAQVKLLEQLEQLACGIDGKIQGQGGFLARHVILGSIGVALSDQRKRLADTQKLLDKLTPQLPKCEADLKEFTS